MYGIHPGPYNKFGYGHIVPPDDEIKYEFYGKLSDNKL